MVMNDDNLARQLNSQVQPQQQPIPEKKPVHIPSPQKRGLTRFEMGVMTFFVILLFGLLVFNIAVAMQVSTTSREVQDINRTSVEMRIENGNLEQNVQELSRYDRVYEIARQYGLEINEENIRNVLP